MRISAGGLNYAIQPVALKPELAESLLDSASAHESVAFELRKESQTVKSFSAETFAVGPISGYCLQPIPTLERGKPIVETLKAGVDIGSMWSNQVPTGVADAFDGVAAIFSTVEVIQHWIDPNPKVQGVAETLLYAKAASSVATALANFVPGLAHYTPALKTFGLILKGADGVNSAYLVREE